MTLLALAALLGPACRDHDAERLARAKIRYEALVREGEPASGPRFAEVLSELEAVAPSSSSAAEAGALAARIRNAQLHVRTPLALGAKTTRPPALEAQLRACARLAELAGVDGGVGARELEALEACRRSAERLELKLTHGEDEHTRHGE